MKVERGAGVGSGFSDAAYEVRRSALGAPPPAIPRQCPEQVRFRRN